MPKVSKLETQVFYKGPSSRGKFGKYSLHMTWDSQYLQYKKNLWKKLDFRKVVSWEAKAGGYTGTFMDTRRPPCIVLRTSQKNTTEEREFAFRHEEFENWLYWIIRAILKYSKAAIPDEQISGLSSKHKAKVVTRRDLKAFDKSHNVFVSTLVRLNAQREGTDQTGRLDKKKEFAKKFQSKPRMKSKLPTYVDEGPSIYGRTEAGTTYSKTGKKIGKGGSDTVIFEVQKLLEPILERKAGGGIGHKLVRPAEPMVVKVPKFHEFDDFPYRDLIREARILAALGRHRNIVGLIDAHLHSARRLFLFLEKGYVDLGAYRPEKKKNMRPLRPPLIRKYTAGILAGIDHMHQRRIYHLDMKPENVIICKADTPKIIDFGLSKTRILDSKKEMFDEEWGAYGTKGYMPPESWTAGAVSKESDLIKRDSYAVGMTIFEALLAPYCNWKELKIKSAVLEGPKLIGKRIKHWQELARNEANRKKLSRAGLLIVADAALGLIEEDPEIRLTVGQALEFIKIDLKQRRRERTMDRDDTLTSMREYHYLRDQLKKSRD